MIVVKTKRGIFLKRKMCFTTIIFFIIFLIICLIIYYKTTNIGNNINIQSKEDVEDYILNIKKYTAIVECIVKSNKNENKYTIKQVEKENYSYQEIINGNNTSIIIENNEGKIKIRNNTLSLEKIYEKHDYILENMLYLYSFIEEYKTAENREIEETKEYYIVKIKIKKYKNKYVVYKNLYINKNSNKIEKLEVQDINKNRTIYILYKEITINN